MRDNRIETLMNVLRNGEKPADENTVRTVADSLLPEQKEMLEKALSDRAFGESLLQSPAAKAILEKLAKGEK